MKQYIIFNFQRILGAGSRRYSSSLTNEKVRGFKNDLFSREKFRQQSLTTRVEKIEVTYRGVPSDTTMIMNKNISTPYNCAQHIHEVLCQRSVLAEVNGELWDMHRPLVKDCELKFFNFLTAPKILNKVYWRSCSFLLGLVIERAFKDDYFVELHSWPKPSIESGSYVYDADVGVPNWNPTEEDLKIFTTMMWKLGSEDNVFERLIVSDSLALEMFQHNTFKKHQIPNLSKEGSVVLYRVKDHIDISCGPMIGSTRFVGTTRVASIHQLDRDCGYRFQGVSIPKQLTLSSFAFSVLAERAKKLNTIGLRDAEKSCAKDAL